jgi:hypothetical protein
MTDRPLQEGGKSPFGAYRLLSATFNGGLIGLAGAAVVLRRFKVPLSPTDLLMLGAATHKLALIVTRERVTMPLRSPFTKQSDGGREGGHHSEPKGQGLQRALGELLTCPHCIAPWISLLLVGGYVVAPLPTRFVTTVFSTVALADMLFHAYGWLDAKRNHQTLERERVEAELKRDAEPQIVQPS